MNGADQLAGSPDFTLGEVRQATLITIRFGESTQDS